MLGAYPTDPLGAKADPPPDLEAWREGFRSVGPRTFDRGGEVGRRFHLDAAAWLEMATIARTGPVRSLPVSLRPEVADTELRLPDGNARFAAYVAQDPYVDAAIVVHRGQIVFEAYPRMEPWQRHFAWSVSKVLASTALGALVGKGELDPERDVTAWLPELAGTAWAGTSLRDVANMASGIDCLDADGYQTPTTCIYRLEEALGITAPTGYDGGLLAHLQAMTRRGPAGVRNEYVSANTVVLGLVLEAVTGQPFARAVQDLLWGPMGAEADGLMAISTEGFAYTSSGLHLRLRDLARFGALYTQPEISGVLDAAFLTDVRGPEGIALDEAQRTRLAEDFPGDVPVRAAWQWDLVWADGALYKGGYSGQGLYVDPARALVIAWFGTGEDYGARRNVLRSVARQLANSGLFDPD
jgi:CubicO group peptidase (beta-lactamase class C family)